MFCKHSLVIKPRYSYQSHALPKTIEISHHKENLQQYNDEIYIPKTVLHVVFSNKKEIQTVRSGTTLSDFLSVSHCAELAFFMSISHVLSVFHLNYSN